MFDFLCCGIIGKDIYKASIGDVDGTDLSQTCQRRHVVINFDLLRPSVASQSERLSVTTIWNDMHTIYLLCESLMTIRNHHFNPVRYYPFHYKS